MRLDILIADVIGDVALVLILSSVLASAARRCGQPAVVGQMLAGLLLGPTVLGHLPGHLTARIFPPAVLPSLTVLAQLAVVIFMFVVGYELDQRSVRTCRKAALLVATSTVLVPMGLGTGAALIFKSAFSALGERHSSEAFALFIGISVSVTALPVLAAIVRELGIARSRAGVTAVSAAGIMDVGTWLVLAAILVSSAHKPGHPWPLTLLLTGCFAVIMLIAVRPALRRWMARSDLALPDRLLIALVLLLASAWVTGSLGLHPVFGGFLAGLTMPRSDDGPDVEVLRSMERIAGLLLPLFFVVTGLSLNITALTVRGLAVLALICAIGNAGKLVPAYLTSRLSGLGQRDSATIAALLNTRGLTELIALNVGLSAGLIGKQLFAVLVLMALLTTMMTAPLLSLIGAKAVPPMTSRPHESPEFQVARVPTRDLSKQISRR